VDRIGGREPIQINIRVIATTNRSLRQEVEQGRFREDLYYRLNVFPITLPPLRERASDIPVLARHFVRATAVRNGLGVPKITEAALNVLLGRAWKGNVRELENAVERAGSIDKKKVRDALASTDITTFYGPIKFSANGMNQVRDLPLIQVQDKAIKVLAPADIKNGDMTMIK